MNISLVVVSFLTLHHSHKQKRVAPLKRVPHATLLIDENFLF